MVSWRGFEGDGKRVGMEGALGKGREMGSERGCGDVVVKECSWSRWRVWMVLEDLMSRRDKD